jgi:hypothetical protein
MRTEKEPRCPYWILGAEFRVMRVLENGRQICEHCGHIIFHQDRAFWCPCQKCVEVHFSLKNARFFSIRPRFAGVYHEPGKKRGRTRKG